MRIFSLLLAFFFTAGAGVASETPWLDHDGMLRTRIVAASQDMASKEGVLLAWEAKLAPGWKTYWRSPGEAGLPVRVFIGDEEIAPLYPYPDRFELFGIQTFGYSHQLLLPFRVKSLPAGSVKIRVDFMVCKDICVPFEQAYELDSGEIEAAGDYQDIRFDTWLAKVPQTGSAPNAEMEILSAKVAGKVGHQKLIIDVSADTDLTSADMLAEVNSMFFFGAPKIRLLEDGRKARMVLSAMTAKKPHNLRGRDVRLTFSNGRGVAIERTFQLAK